MSSEVRCKTVAWQENFQFLALIQLTLSFVETIWRRVLCTTNSLSPWRSGRPCDRPRAICRRFKFLMILWNGKQKSIARSQILGL